MSFTTEVVAEARALRCSDLISAPVHQEIVEHMSLYGAKWDPQIGDTSILAPFAAIISTCTRDLLFAMAERLSAELQAVETRLASRPELWPALGLPPAVRALLESDEPWTPCAARIVRYDFHLTTDGWRISEVNSDVPGGMNEATVFAGLVAEQIAGTEVPGEPLYTLADALAEVAIRQRRIAGVAAPGLLEDRQVVASLTAPLRSRRVDLVHVTPDQVRWDESEAYVCVSEERLSVGAIFRFFQGEWAKRVSSPQWRFAFRGGKTPICNPATAILTESKRLPLLWDKLHIEMPTWRALLPESFSPWSRRALSRRSLRKRSYSNTGESVLSSSWSPRAALAAAWLHGVARPRDWVAQSLFHPVWIETPVGLMQPCLGVYTINGRPCGIYGRFSTHRYIDFRARDVAVLVSD